MTVKFTEKGLSIWPESDFETSYLEDINRFDIKIIARSSVSHADFIYLELIKCVRDNE